MYSKMKNRNNEKRWWVIIFLLFVSIPIVFGIISCDQAESNLSRKENEERPEIDRLFREMGIIQVPHIAPPVDFSLLNLNNKTVTLSDLKGKIVFLNFWTTWCGECRVEMPLMQKLYIRFKDKGFAMVAVSLNEPKSVVEKFFDDYKLTFTALLDSDGELGIPFGIRGIPMTYILDRDGGIIGKAFGARQWDSKESFALFEQLLKESDIEG
jgi:peroxiredoxin